MSGALGSRAPFEIGNFRNHVGHEVLAPVADLVRGVEQLAADRLAGLRIEIAGTWVSPLPDVRIDEGVADDVIVREQLLQRKGGTGKFGAFFHGPLLVMKCLVNSAGDRL